MELFQVQLRPSHCSENANHLSQSSLLKYWEFEPCQEDKRGNQGTDKRRRPQELPASDPDRPHVGHGPYNRSTVDSLKVKWRSLRRGAKGKERERDLPQSSARNSESNEAQGDSARVEKEKIVKKMPVRVSIGKILCLIFTLPCFCTEGYIFRRGS